MLSSSARTSTSKLSSTLRAATSKETSDGLNGARRSVSTLASRHSQPLKSGPHLASSSIIPASNPIRVSKRLQTTSTNRRAERVDNYLGQSEAQKQYANQFIRDQAVGAWPKESLVRLLGQNRTMNNANLQSKQAHRQRFLFNWHTNIMRRSHADFAKWHKRRAYFSETVRMDPRWSGKQAGEMGLDAVYKYRPNPHHLKFRSFGIHPRPLESNLVTGNEKTADRILPPDYMDRIFNQVDAARPISERFKLRQDKFHYNLHEYRTMGLKQKFIARFFHTAMPHAHESLNVPFYYRRRYHGSNEVFIWGAWVDRREVNDFFTMISLLTVGAPGIAIVKSQFEAEKLQGQLISERDGLETTTMEKRTRFIMDSDRTKKPTFEAIQPLPRKPALD